jgi:hypothetical protein
MHYSLDTCADCDIKGENMTNTVSKKKNACRACRTTEKDLILLLIEMCAWARRWNRPKSLGAHVIIVSFIKHVTKAIRNIRRG